MTKLHNVNGRIHYITSTEKQENLFCTYSTAEDETFWDNLARENRQKFLKSGAEGNCIEARELIIALPKLKSYVDPKSILRQFTDMFKNRYGVECVSALHYNKTKTNLHIHLIFSESLMSAEPEIKKATRNRFYDEKGKHVRTKKEILNEKGEIRKGCSIIKKGEIYESNMFEKKNPFFKTREFLKEVKEMYTDRINSKGVMTFELNDVMEVFNKDGPYLPTKKIGINNPRAYEIERNNELVREYNKQVDKIIQEGIPKETMVSFKKREIIVPLRKEMRKKNPREWFYTALISFACEVLSIVWVTVWSLSTGQRKRAISNDLKTIIFEAKAAVQQTSREWHRERAMKKEFEKEYYR